MATATDPAIVPPFTPEHERLREEMRAFVVGELRPHAPEWEAAHWFPNEVFGWCAQRGYLGLRFERAYGGGEDPVAAAIFAQELARCGSGGLAAGIGAHTSIALSPIAQFGTDEQKRRWLAPGIRGERIAALAITEPDAGSDVAGIRTRAVREDGGYRVSGSKMFITNGVRAELLVTAVKTTDEGGHGGLSFLVVERGDGVESSAIEKLGWHASDTALISFDDVWVPEENLLGEENRGFYLIMANFQWERLVMALGAIGAMEATLERVIPMLRERERVSQTARHRVAEMGTALQAGRDLTHHALRRHLAGADAVREVTMAKLHTQRAALDTVDGCLDLVGPDPELERGLRDARLGPIGGGTDEIMSEILGRSLGL
jgi:acyl-CoA dehydrogenase